MRRLEVDSGGSVVVDGVNYKSNYVIRNYDCPSKWIESANEKPFGVFGWSGIESVDGEEGK